MKKVILSICILFCAANLIFVIWNIYYFVKRDREESLDHTRVNHYTSGCFAENEKNLIWYDGNKIFLYDKMNKEISSLSLDDLEVQGVNLDRMDGESVALGEKGYYFLGQNFEKNHSYLYQMDYTTNQVLDSMTLKDVNKVYCQNGYLFFETDSNYNKVMEKGIYANRYIKEESFGSSLLAFPDSGEEVCEMEGLVLYQHKGGYFSTEPVLNMEYPGCDSYVEGIKEIIDYGRMDADEIDIGWRRLLFPFLRTQMGDTNDFCQVWEVQRNTKVWGICNNYEGSEKRNPEIPQIESTEFIAYVIDGETNTVNLVKKGKGESGIAVSDSYVIYQQGNSLIRETWKSGEMETLAVIKDRSALQIDVLGNFLYMQECVDLGEGIHKQMIEWNNASGSE